MQSVVGVDIGGANLKAAIWKNHREPDCSAIAFPLWKQPQQLGGAIGKLIAGLGGADQLAVTMTGELADCFASRQEGVERILTAVATAFPSSRTKVYTVDGRWFTPAKAIDDPWTVAASNWHALANWLGRWPLTAHLCRQTLLVDIGSTTVDIIPLVDGAPKTSARTDRDRLAMGQLVYTGISRTPICAITPTLTLQGVELPVMAELFATVDDAYMILSLVEEDPADCWTADGRPRTRSCAAGRLARMVGEDSQRLTKCELEAMAEQVIAAQAALVASAIERNTQTIAEDPRDPPTLLFTGHGRPLFDRTVDKLKLLRGVDPRAFTLESFVPLQTSRCAPAAAVSWLLSEVTSTNFVAGGGPVKP